MPEPVLSDDTRYSLDWIVVGNRTVPLVRTWIQDQSKLAKAKCYLHVPLQNDRRNWDETNYFRAARTRRSKSGLLRINELEANIRAAVRTPSADTRRQQQPISERVVFRVSTGSVSADRLGLIISTFLRQPCRNDCCCNRKTCQPTVELNLRRGKLVSRTAPIHCGPEYAARHSCSWDRLDLWIRGCARQALEVEQRQTEVQPSPKADLVLWLNGQPIDRDALRRCEVVYLQDFGAVSLAQLVEAERVKQILIWNGIIGAKEVGAFRSLADLELIATGNTTVTESALRGLKWLPNKVQLRLGLTRLDDDAVQLLAQLPGLIDTSFSGKRVTNLSIRKLTRRQSLQSLSLKNCRLTNFGVELIPRLPQLKSLSLSECELTSRAMRVVGSCQGLEYLNLAHTRLADQHCPQLSTLPKLQRLIIEGTQVTDCGLDVLAESGALKVLCIGGTRQITRASIERFWAKRPDIKLRTVGLH
ncbi:leucine-rich repeat domain-containing protein [Anatilimnocola sp. NA78]|uniref:leucine-rich repeat domain-containing protein n=1 Tax=Anatilimnocola sp. NA78 TaxID=3415683 RepID=UPI003CE4B0CC